MYLFLTLCSLMLFFSFAVYSLSLLFSTSARTTFLLRKLVPSEVSYLQFLLISVHIFYFHLLSSLTHAFGVSWRQYFIEFCTFIHIGNLCPVCLCVPVHLCTHVATHACAGYTCMWKPENNPQVFSGVITLFGGRFSHDGFGTCQG